MSVQAITWAITRHIKPSGAKLLLICLSNYADDKGVCWPSKATLALDCSADKSTVCRWLKILEKEGFVSIEKRFESNTQISSKIFLSLPSQRTEVAKNSECEKDTKTLSHTATQNRYNTNGGSVSPPCDRGVHSATGVFNPKPRKLSALKPSKADWKPEPGYEKY